MINESGNLSVNTEDIFPIIKKWLYPIRIYFFEMVSNACDAIAKFKRLVSLGEADADPDEQYKIRVVLDKKQNHKNHGQRHRHDRRRSQRYINQVAFSGAKEFLEKYKDQNEASQIIGHFGLGFYSAFMVSDKVEIDTLSWQEGRAGQVDQRRRHHL